MMYTEPRLEDMGLNKRQLFIAKRQRAIRDERIWQIWLGVKARMAYEEAMEIVDGREKVQPRYLQSLR